MKFSYLKRILLFQSLPSFPLGFPQPHTVYPVNKTRNKIRNEITVTTTIKPQSNIKHPIPSHPTIAPPTFKYVDFLRADLIKSWLASSLVLILFSSRLSIWFLFFSSFSRLESSVCIVDKPGGRVTVPSFTAETFSVYQEENNIMKNSNL